MLERESRLRSAVASIEPSSVVKFLARNGYTPRNTKQGHSQLLENANKQLLIVPLDRSFSDYAKNILGILELFVDDYITIEDVVNLVVLPEVDVFKYRVETPDTKWGSLQLAYSYEAIHALFDVLKYTAAGAASGKTDYRNVSDMARAYINGCRFGQTEFGSYVLKVYCPINPLRISDTENEAFGRKSTRAALENFNFVNSHESDNPSIPLPATFNRQVASAIMRLKPHSDFGTTNVAVKYLVSAATALPSASNDLLSNSDTHPIVKEELELGPLIYSKAQSLRDRLAKAEEFGHEVLQGYVTDLHKDRPTSNEQSRQITLEVKYGSSFRKATMRLMPELYKKALFWHDNNIKIVVDAVFDKRGNPWSVYDLKFFNALNKTEGTEGLFDSFDSKSNKPS